MQDFPKHAQRYRPHAVEYQLCDVSSRCWGVRHAQELTRINNQTARTGKSCDKLSAQVNALEDQLTYLTQQREQHEGNVLMAKRDAFQLERKEAFTSPS
jgi:chromosome segregation ATPase